MLTSTQIQTLLQHHLTVDPETCFLDDGAYSTVIKACGLDGEIFAVKIVDKSQIVRYDKVPSVLREKEILHFLSHPNVVKLKSTFQDSHSLYFVLEYCNGGCLYNFDYEKRNEIIFDSLFKQLIEAISYLHAKGIIHRDIKPENILLSRESSFDDYVQFKLADFGSVGRPDIDPPADLLKFLGTPEYLAPELIKSNVNKENAAAGDWWALGCTLYWYFTGKLLFAAATEYLVYKKIETWADSTDSDREESLKAIADLHYRSIISDLLAPDPLHRLDFIRNLTLDR